MWYEAYLKRRQFHTGFWSRNLKEKDHVEYLSIDWRKAKLYTTYNTSYFLSHILKHC